MALANAQWALGLEVIRHVGPFLGLSFNELQVLEAFCGVSIRQQALTASTSSPGFRHDLVADTRLDTILHKLQESRVFLPHGNDLAVNVYGLVSFYAVLAGDSSPRRATRERLSKIAGLLKALKAEFGNMCVPLLDLAVPFPDLRPRPRVQVGRAQPVVDTLLKWRLIDACMSVAVNHLRTMSELVVLMRCVNMTLERNALECPTFSIDRVLYGHAGRGSLGLPIGARSVKSALQSLQDKGVISIKRRYARCKVGKMLLNLAGITALYARDHKDIRTAELHWSTRDIIRRVMGIDPFDHILHERISEVLNDLTATDLHRNIHAALAAPSGSVRVMGKWSSGPCPLAEATHDHGVDDHPSFEIYADEGGSLLYTCWACGDGQVRPLSHLFCRMKECLGEFPLHAHRVAQSASRLVKLGAIDMSQFAHAEPLDSKQLKTYPVLTRYTKDTTGFLKEYLRSRGISDAAYDHFRVRYLPMNHGKYRVPKTVVTEFTLTDGAVAALRLRTILKKNRRFNTIGSLGPAMFGLAQADTSQPLLVVEGEIDALCAYSLGFWNVVATGGANRNALALAGVLRSWGKRKMYLGLDSDPAGQQAQERLIDALKSDIRDLYTVDWAQVLLGTPTHTEQGTRITCKDAADVPSKEAFWSAIKKAEPAGSSCSARRQAHCMG